MRRIFNKKRSFVALAAVAALAIAGAAFAYFTSTGSGSATGTVGTATNWSFGTASLVTGSATTLYPESNSVTPNTDGSPGAITTGANVEKFSYTVTNPSKGNQYLSKVHVSIDSTTLGTKGCTASDFSLNGATAGTAVDDSSLKGDFTTGQVKTGYVTIEMIDSNVAQDGCQGISPGIVLAAS